MKISIQPANTESGEYDPALSRPFPYTILDSGAVDDQEFWNGDPSHLIGFQNDVDRMEVDVMFRDFWADPEIAVGKFPVFSERGGGFFTYTLPIQYVYVTEVA